MMTNQAHLYLLVATVACVVPAAVIDILTHKIPNWLTFPSVVAGLLINFHLDGLNGLFFSLLGLTTGFLLLIAVYLLGGMGAGDVKLLCAVGSLLGAKLVFYTFIWMALAGGILALALIIYKRAFSQTLRNLRILLLGWLLHAPTENANLTLRNQSLIKLPYGVAIAIGAILAVYLRRIPTLGF